MKERQILFSGPMVRAVLREKNPKTITRRRSGLKKINEAPGEWTVKGWCVKGTELHYQIENKNSGQVTNIRCPYGKPGDTLRMRENYGFGKGYDGTKASDIPESFNLKVWYQAAGQRPEWAGKLRPSIYMPAWASRQMLEVAGVRLERLQDITEADAIAEGLTCLAKDGSLFKWGIPDRDGLPGTDDEGWRWDEWKASPVQAFAYLIDTVNPHGTWAANGWVWVIEFRKVGK